MSCDGYCSVALPHSTMGLQDVIVVFPDHYHLRFCNLILYVPVNNFSIMLERVFLGLTSTAGKQ